MKLNEMQSIKYSSHILQCEMTIAIVVTVTGKQYVAAYVPSNGHWLSLDWNDDKFLEEIGYLFYIMNERIQYVKEINPHEH